MDTNTFISDCGKYIAIRYDQFCNFDVLAVDGSCVWLTPRYRPKTHTDDDPRFVFPEFAHMVGGFSNNGRTTRSGRYIEDFELSFSDHDQTIKTDPFTGNTVIQSYSARFRRPVKLARSRRAL